MPSKESQSSRESKATYVWDLKVSHVPAPSNNSRADDGHSLNDVQICLILIPLCSKNTRRAPPRELLFLNEAAAASLLSLSLLGFLCAALQVSGVINYSYFGFDKLPRRRRHRISREKKIPQQTTTNLSGGAERRKKASAAASQHSFLRHAPRC